MNGPKLSHWLCARVTPGDVPVEYNAVIMDWLAGYGVDAKECLNGLVITNAKVDDTIQYFLHVSLLVRDDGKTIVDHAADHVASTPLVIPLGTEMPTEPWIAIAVANQQAAWTESPTFQRGADSDSVTVLTAPRRTRMSLELVVNASPSLLKIDGERINVGKLESGEDVIYRVVGWDDDHNVLKLWRSEPEEDSPPLAAESPAAPTDGLKKLAEASKLLATGGLVRPSSGLTHIGETP